MMTSELADSPFFLPHRDIEQAVNDALGWDRPAAVLTAKPLFDAGMRLANITERVNYRPWQEGDPLPHGPAGLPAHIFTLLLQGDLGMHVGDRIQWILPGQLVYNPPLTNFGRVGKPGTSAWFLYIELFDTPRWDALKSLDPFVRDYEHADLMYRALRSILDALHGAGELSVAHGCSELLINLLRAEAARSGKATGEQHDDLRQMMEEIRKHPERRWNTAEMARTLHMSRATLTRRCQFLYNMPPKQMIMTIRFSIAMELLRQTDDTIQAIATRIGYDSAYTFSNQFEKRTGMRPGAFRAKNRSR